LRNPFFACLGMPHYAPAPAQDSISSASMFGTGAIGQV
jgi:hypothetical protein